MSNSYLGPKGYTIYKNEITVSQQNRIKEELNIKPYVSQGEAKLYPVYRESLKKLYVPRYYGLSQLGPPKTSTISEGDSIDVEFNGTLREKQQVVVQTYLNKVKEQPIEGGLLELPCAFGKCLGKDTEIVMYDGSINCVRDIKQGDQLMGDDSTPRNVKTICRGQEKMYEIRNIQENSSYLCNESHILSLVSAETKQKTDISVKKYLNLTLKERNNLKGYKTRLHFETKRTEMDPYVYGYYFIKNNRIKIIPAEYLYNSVENRELFLLGILDSIGEIINNHVYIRSSQFQKQIMFLARSLGYLCKQQTEGLIVIYGILDGIKSIDFKTRCQLRVYKDLSYHIQLLPLEIDDYYGFEIDGNRRFVLGDLSVTHNTILSLNIISRLAKKTLIIVHKEFLMNQWIERIEQFLPTAKIGKIQGQIVDTDEKDIVIGMLQSLSMKEYPASLFESFGLTIIDEVHHISSEVFSKSLFKIVTKHTLGLSATMNRKDGTTRVFKMFLGEVIFKGDRDEERDVTVRALEYRSHDEEFEETQLDFRGKPAFSTMISKICQYNRRSEFILKVLGDMLKENPKQQVMILAHNRNILTYFHDAIKHRNMATTGYYLGGMKEKALKETETKQVVIATYAMAAEALDIKTLTTLIMATSKTDIQQSVGRILREKHSQPIVVDIIDTHDIFKSQWNKRKVFYKKEKYKILHTNSDKYDANIETWTPILMNKSKGKNKNSINMNSKIDITFDDDDEDNKNKTIGVCLLKMKK